MKYKAKLKSWYFSRKEKASAKLKAGTPQITIWWKTTHSEGAGGVWIPIAEDAQKELTKTYYLGNDEVQIGDTGVTKTRTVMAKENMEKEFNLPMDAPNPDQAVGFENILVTEMVGEYENVKYVNNPSKKANTMKAEDKADFASIWGSPQPPVQETPPPPTEDDCPF